MQTLFISDLYDTYDEAIETVDPSAAIANLSARWLWHALTGVYPSKPDAALIQSPTVEHVLQIIHRVSVPVTPPREVLERIERQHATYVDKLRTDSDFLSCQLILKWWDRFACRQSLPPKEVLDQTDDLLQAYTDIVLKHSRFAKLLNFRCASVETFFELAMHAIETRGLGIVNLLSGAINKANGVDVRQWKGKLCVEDALRMSIVRDRQLCMQLVNAPLLVDAGCDRTLLDAMNAASNRAVVRVHAGDACTTAKYHVVQLQMPSLFPFVVHFFPKWSSHFVWACALDELPAGKASAPKHNVIRLVDDAFPEACWPLAEDYDRIITSSFATALKPPTRAPSIYCIPADAGGLHPRSFFAPRLGCMQKLLWKHHMTLSCPLRSPGATQPSDGMLLFTRFLCNYVEQHADEIEEASRAPLQRFDAKGTVLVCDNRPSLLTVIAAVATMINLKRHTWRLTVVCTPATVDFYKTVLPEAWIEGTRFLTIDDYPSEKFSVQSYSTLLKTDAFWKNITEDYCLIVQDDGMILKPGVESYMKYDYVGAPWLPNPVLEAEANPCFVGNGGVSLRSTRVMESICARHHTEAQELFSVFPQELPEDVFFARFVHADDYKLCPQHEAAQFAVEQVMNESALGFHKPWAYHHPKTVQHLFARYLGTKRKS